MGPIDDDHLSRIQRDLFEPPGVPNTLEPCTHCRRVDPARDTIRVDGKRIPPPRIHVYLMLNKPKGVVCTMDDPEGRRTVADLLTTRKERLFHVGRLDTPTEGLLLITNDGDFAQRMSHPKYELTKTYVAEIEGVLDQKTAARLRRGVTLEDGKIKPDRLKVGAIGGNRTMVTVVLHSGRNRVVRRMFEAVGVTVSRLMRVRFGIVTLPSRLKRGQFYELNELEVSKLMHWSGLTMAGTRAD